MNIEESKEYLKMRNEKYKRNKKLIGLAENIYGSEAVKEYDKKYRAIETVLTELEKKDKMIDEMAEWITKIDPTIYCDKSKCDDNCKECVIKGFTNKVEREGK